MSVASESHRTTGVEGWYLKQDEQFVATALSDDLRAKAIRDLEAKRWNQHWLSIGLAVATGLIALGTLIASNVTDRPGSPADILPLFIMSVVTTTTSYQLIHYDFRIRLLKLVSRMQERGEPRSESYEHVSA